MDIAHEMDQTNTIKNHFLVCNNKIYHFTTNLFVNSYTII